MTYTASDIAHDYGKGKVRSSRQDTKGRWRIDCPVHGGDGQNLLVWDNSQNGHVMFHCPAGCQSHKIHEWFVNNNPRYAQSCGQGASMPIAPPSPIKKASAATEASSPNKFAAIELGKTTRAADGEFKPKVPAPADIPPPEICPYKRDWGKPDHVYPLLNADGTLFNYDYRWNNPPGSDRKQFKPCYYWEDHTHNGKRCPAGWYFRGSLDNKPLYRAPELASGDNRPVLVVEGHAAMEAAQEHYPDHLAITWQGSATSWKQSDWSLLSNRQDVKLWPDADGPGKNAMNEIAAHLKTLNATCSIVDVSALPPGHDMADPEPPGVSYDALLAAAEPYAVPVVEWPDPLPLEQVAPGEMFGADVETFPIEAFSSASWLRDYVAELATQQNIPVEVTSTLALGMLSATIQRRVRIEGKANWREHTNLWVMAIFPPGSTKTATLRAIAKPATLWEKRREIESRQECIEAANEEKIIMARQAAVTREANKAKTSEDRKLKARELTELQMELDALPTRKPRRLVYEDFTEESLFGPLAEKQNKECGLVMSAESTKLFDVLGGMYNNGQSSCTLFPKTYDGERHVRDRVSVGSQTLDEPLLAVLQFVQPKPFDSVINHDTFKGRGVIQRYILLRGQIDFANYDTEAPAMSEAVEQKYIRFIMGLLDDDAEDVVLTLSTEAAAVFRAFRKEFIPMLCPETGEFGEEDIAEWGSKQAGRVLRLAACLHVAKHPIDYPGREVGPDTVERAIMLGKYYLHRANQVLGIMRELPVQSNAKYALKHLRKLAGDGCEPVKHTELWDHVKKRMKNDSTFSEALAYLEECNIIRQREELTPGAKRKARVYDINPKAVVQ